MKSKNITVDEFGLSSVDYQELVNLFKKIESQTDMKFANALVTEAAVSIQLDKINSRGRLIAEKVSRLADSA